MIYEIPDHKPPPLRGLPNSSEVRSGKIRLCWSNCFYNRLYTVYYEDEYFGCVGYSIKNDKKHWFIFADRYPGNEGKEWEKFASQKSAIVALIKWRLESKNGKSK